MPVPCKALPVPWPQVKGILFDVDGTLTHSDDLHFKAFVDLLVEANFRGGEPISRDFFNDHIAGRHNPEIAADLFPDWPVEERKQFTERKEAYYRQLAATAAGVAHTKIRPMHSLKEHFATICSLVGKERECLAELQPIPGLKDFLKRVDTDGLRKIAVTNAPPDNVALMLQCIGLADYFEDVVYGEHCPRAKPHPDPYLIGLETIGIDASEALIFEDSPSGIRAGVAAGIKVIALTTTQQPDRLKAAGASLLVEDYHEVLTLLQR